MKDAIALVISISLVVYAITEVAYIAYKTNDDFYKLEKVSKGGVRIPLNKFKSLT